MNALPIVGWFISIFCAMSTSVPFWFFWTYLGLGEKYMGFMPSVYLHPSFWDCVGCFVLAWIVKGSFVPNLATVTNNQEVKKGEKL